MTAHLSDFPFLPVGATWADFFEAFAAALDLGEDRFGGGCPHKGLGLLVVRSDEFHDLFYQVRHALETASAHGLVGQLGEPTLHQIEPA